MKTKQTERGLCEHTDGQRAQTKMFIIAHYQRHANQSYREISSHTSQNGIIYQKVYKSYRLKRVWGKGSPTHRGWECTLVQPLWKTAWRFLRTKNRAAVPPSNRTAGCQTDTRTPVGTEARLTAAKPQTQLRCPSADEQVKKMRSMDAADAIQSYQEGNNCHLWQHDGPRDSPTK